LARQAIEAFVAREMEIIEGINRGLADMKAGRVIPHDEAMRRVRQAIERALEEKS
jgi:predicted transcriptional regulator